MRLSKEIYDFGLPDDRMNFFMQKTVQKYRSSCWIYGKENAYAYMPIISIRGILGRGNYQQRLNYLIENNYIQKIIIKKHNLSGNNIIGYVPLVLDYEKKKRNHKFMDNYYNNIEKSLSPIAKQILRNLRKTKIDITENKFWDIMGVPNDEKTLDAYRGMYREIKKFNSSSAKEINEYISEDNFGNRVHTIISRLPKQIRKDYIRINGQSTVEIDLAQSQPTLLGKLLESKIGDNSFSSLVRRKDIYIEIANLANIERDEAKTVFYEIVFGRHKTKYTEMFFSLFPDTMEYITKIKNIKLKENPSNKRHSNLAFLLQQKESSVFRQVWGMLRRNKVDFLTVHDSIIIQSNNLNKYVGLITKELSRHIHSNINITINV